MTSMQIWLKKKVVENFLDRVVSFRKFPNIPKARRNFGGAEIVQTAPGANYPRHATAWFSKLRCIFCFFSHDATALGPRVVMVLSGALGTCLAMPWL